MGTKHSYDKNGKWLGSETTMDLKNPVDRNLAHSYYSPETTSRVKAAGKKENEQEGKLYKLGTQPAAAAMFWRSRKNEGDKQSGEE